jgi:hypothetical protein
MSVYFSYLGKFCSSLTLFAILRRASCRSVPATSGLNISFTRLSGSLVLPFFNDLILLKAVPLSKPWLDFPML